MSPVPQMTVGEAAIIEALRSVERGLGDVRREAREDRTAIFAEISVVRREVSAIATNGCAKQAEHASGLKDHEDRIRAGEKALTTAQSEARARGRVNTAYASGIAALFSAAVAVFCSWKWGGK
jgi:hypothetical protein